MSERNAAVRRYLFRYIRIGPSEPPTDRETATHTNRARFSSRRRVRLLDDHGTEHRVVQERAIVVVERLGMQLGDTGRALELRGDPEPLLDRGEPCNRCVLFERG